MTTAGSAEEGTPRRLSDRRVGALAAVTPIAVYLAWNAIAGWGGSVGQFVLATAEIALGAGVAGWIVGGRIGRSIPGRILGLVAYGFVGTLVLLPLNVAGSTLDDVHGGRVGGTLEVVGAAFGYLAYGLVSSLYVSVFLLPFGAAWMATFILLRRAVSARPGGARADEGTLRS